MAPAVMWGVAGLGVGLFAASQLGNNNNGDLMSQMQALQAQQAQGVTAPEVPVNPATPVDPSNPNDVANPEAEEAARQLAARAEAAKQTNNPTGGLGITSNAPGRYQTLGGS